MSSSIPASVYVEHFDQELAHHRAWLAFLERLVTHVPQALDEVSTLRRLLTEHQQTDPTASTQTKPAESLEDFPQPAFGVAPIGDIPPAVAVAIPLVKQFEGCRLSAYPNPETGGVPWTIGWGTTTYYYGSSVEAGDTISQELADALLAVRFERYLGRLRKLVTGKLRERLHRGEHMAPLPGLFAIHLKLPEGAIAQHLAEGVQGLLQDLLAVGDEQQPRRLGEGEDLGEVLMQAGQIEGGEHGLAGAGGGHHQVVPALMQRTLGLQLIEHLLLVGVGPQLKPGQRCAPT
jgi:hypothetical protein